jgi:hypothetical protein
MSGAIVIAPLFDKDQAPFQGRTQDKEMPCSVWVVSPQVLDD